MTLKQIQHLLAYLGYYTIPVDGITGPGTKEAIKTFQSDFGDLVVDGVAGEATQKALKHAIAYGMEKNTSTDQPSETTDAVPGWENIRNFKRTEFRCPCGKCGGFPVEPNLGLVSTMDKMRDDFGTPIIVVPPDGHSGGSGVRCQAYNDSLSGSVPNSRHVLGKAADFSSPGKSPSTVEGYLGNLQSSGKIRYWYRISNGSWHMDVN